MSKRKNVIILFISVLCGLLGIYLVMTYVNDVKNVYKDKSLKDVVVAVQTIPENAAITKELLKLESIPEEYVLPDSYTKLEDVIGAYATSSIMKKEQIIKQRITRGEVNSQFPYRIPPGKRAVSVVLSPNSDVGGFIRPRDRVDVLVTLPIPEENSGSAEAELNATDGKRTVNVTAKLSWAEDLKFFQKIAQKLYEGKRIVSFNGKSITLTLLQNIDVLAVGNNANKPEQQKDKKEENTEEKNKAGNITLCLDPEQVDLITNAEKIGVVKFTLRHPGDVEVVKLQPILEYKK